MRFSKKILNEGSKVILNRSFMKILWILNKMTLHIINEDIYDKNLFSEMKWVSWLKIIGTTYNTYMRWESWKLWYETLVGLTYHLNILVIIEIHLLSPSHYIGTETVDASWHDYMAD